MSKESNSEPQLLVIMQEPNDVVEQEILESALSCDAIPYSVPGYDNAYIFKDCSINSLLILEEKLSVDDDLPIKIIPSNYLHKASI